MSVEAHPGCTLFRKSTISFGATTSDISKLGSSCSVTALIKFAFSCTTVWSIRLIVYVKSVFWTPIAFGLISVIELRWKNINYYTEECSD